MQTQSIIVTVDPLNAYGHMSHDDLLAWLGFVPGWLSLPELGETFKQRAETGYSQMAGGVYWFRGDFGTVDDRGVYCAPDDPDLYPMAVIEGLPGQRVYMYPYSIVAFIHDGEQSVARLD